MKEYFTKHKIPDTRYQIPDTRILAITGGIASGKTTVSKMFQKYGALVLNADKIAHTVYRRPSAIYRAIVQRYGPTILDAHKQISRKKLAEKIFHSPSEKLWLEKQIHPATLELIGKKIQAALRKRASLILVEAALHVETGYYRNFQGLIVIKAPVALQLQRLMEREKLSRTEALARIKNQMPLSKKLKLADYVIDNSKTLAKTEHQVKRLIKIIAQK